MFALPAEARRSVRFEVLPIVAHVIPSITVYGRRFCVLGTRGPDGRWRSFEEVRPL